MKSKFLRSAVAVGVLAAFSGYAVQASALPLEPFSFHQSAGFVPEYNTQTTTQGVNGIRWWEDTTTGVAPPAGTFDTLAWGYQSGGSGSGLFPGVVDPLTLGAAPDSNFSGLRVTGFEDNGGGAFATGVDLGGQVSDWGNWVTITRIFHHNNRININANTLTSGLIYSELSFDHGGDGIVAVSPGAIPFSFKETKNDNGVNGGTCEDGNYLSTDRFCDDVFQFPAVDFQNISFTTPDGHKYEVRFKIDNFVNSFSDFSTGCVAGTCSVWTAESLEDGSISSLDVLMQIREVPEPSTLALLGLSLLGVAGMRKRSAKA